MPFSLSTYAKSMSQIQEIAQTNKSTAGSNTTCKKIKMHKFGSNNQNAQIRIQHYMNIAFYKVFIFKNLQGKFLHILARQLERDDGAGAGVEEEDKSRQI